MLLFRTIFTTVVVVAVAVVVCCSGTNDHTWSESEPENCPFVGNETDVCSNIVKQPNSTCITVGCCNGVNNVTYDTSKLLLADVVKYEGECDSLCMSIRTCTGYRCANSCCEGYQRMRGFCFNLSGFISCQNGGTPIWTDEHGLRCKCPWRYTGYYCQLDPCKCENGGICGRWYSSDLYYCSCPAEFYGEYCEKEKNFTISGCPRDIITVNVEQNSRYAKVTTNTTDITVVEKATGQHFEPKFYPSKLKHCNCPEPERHVNSVTASYTSTGLSCKFRVVVKDPYPPYAISCQDISARYGDFVILRPTFYDNVGVVKRTFTLSNQTSVKTDKAGYPMIKAGTINRVRYLAFDASGNIGNCSFNVEGLVPQATSMKLVQIFVPLILVVAILVIIFCYCWRKRNRVQRPGDHDGSFNPLPNTICNTVNDVTHSSLQPPPYTSLQPPPYTSLQPPPSYTSLQPPPYTSLQPPPYTSLQPPPYTSLQPPPYTSLQPRRITVLVHTVAEPMR